MADQLAIRATAWGLYAKRDETRRGHLLELFARMGMEQFDIDHYRSVLTWLEATALQATRGVVVARTLVEELRRRSVVLPSIAVIERVAAEAATRAQRKYSSS